MCSLAGAWLVRGMQLASESYRSLDTEPRYRSLRRHRPSKNGRQYHPLIAPRKRIVPLRLPSLSLLQYERAPVGVRT